MRASRLRPAPVQQRKDQGLTVMWPYYTPPLILGLVMWVVAVFVLVVDRPFAAQAAPVSYISYNGTQVSTEDTTGLRVYSEEDFPSSKAIQLASEAESCDARVPMEQPVVNTASKGLAHAEDSIQRISSGKPLVASVRRIRSHTSTVFRERFANLPVTRLTDRQAFCPTGPAGISPAGS